MRKLVLVLAIALTGCAHTTQEIKPMFTPSVAKSTPVLFAKRIEPSLAFWEKLGFKHTSDVPAGDHLAFAILTNGNVEIMYQTLDSAAEDLPRIKEVTASSKTFLFVEVPSLAVARKALNGAPVFLEERKTFYGSTEIGYLEPAGHFVLLAQFEKK
jgi:hypothetical protein